MLMGVCAHAFLVCVRECVVSALLRECGCACVRVCVSAGVRVCGCAGVRLTVCAFAFLV